MFTCFLRTYILFIAFYTTVPKWFSDEIKSNSSVLCIFFLTLKFSVYMIHMGSALLFPSFTAGKGSPFVLVTIAGTYDWTTSDMKDCELCQWGLRSVFRIGYRAMLSRIYQRGRYCNIRLRECSETETTKKSSIFRMKEIRSNKNWIHWEIPKRWQLTKKNLHGNDLNQWNKDCFFVVFIKVP